MRIHPDPDPQPCPDHYIFLNDVNFEDIFLSFPTGARFLLSCLKNYGLRLRNTAKKGEKQGEGLRVVALFYLCEVDEDAGGPLAQPVAADGAVADTQTGRTLPLGVL